ncbi:M42 family metallopeptidase [Cetobacterium somerae]|uniref:M42 family metallopeptidase n=1 Tax=Cetobacterium somerae TaxID=188913 RepID=UPI003D767FCF
MKLDLNYTLEFTKEILSIPSPAGYTEKAMERIAQELDALGYSYTYSKKGCLIVKILGKDSNYTRLLSAHIDTLGAMVKKVKKNGRLELINIGGYAWGSVEGENVTIHTLDGKEYEGTVLPIKASVHVYGDIPREMPRIAENMEVRLDENVYSEEDTRSLGICQGDFVSYYTKTKITESGYIKSRYLDDKLCVAQSLAYLKYLKDNNEKPNNNLYIYFSNFEEVGHGVSEIPNDVDEFIALDIGLVAEDADGDEKKVSIAARDNKTVYDLKIRKHLQEVANNHNIKYTVGVYNRYGSDATASILQGADLRYACIGPNVDATHHYERTHIDGIIETIKLLVAYL